MASWRAFRGGVAVCWGLGRRPRTVRRGQDTSRCSPVASSQPGFGHARPHLAGGGAAVRGVCSGVLVLVSSL